MILATGLSDEQMVRLRSAGFNPVREDIDALGLGYVRLQTPDDKSLAQSIRQARKIAPDAAIGSNPIYFQSGPTTRGSGALADGGRNAGRAVRSEETTSELQSLLRTSSTVFCLIK